MNTDHILQSLEKAESLARNELKDENRYLKKLLEVSRTISTLNLSESLEMIMNSVVEITKGQRGVLALTDEGEEPKIAYAVGLSETELNSKEFEISDSIVKDVLKSRKSKLIENIILDGDYKNKPSVVALKLKAVMCVPLICHDKTIGVIYVDTNRSEHAFSKSELQLFEAFASQAAIAIDNAKMFQQLKTENILMHKELRGLSPFPELVHESPEMKNVCELVQRVLDNSVTVLITGETGSGKEMVARAIHYNSGRKDKPFVAVNCGALTESLLESELFGHKKGAFTGAVENKTGLFEAASGSTIFLDEIGETTPAIQIRLLRVLETQTIRRIGETADRKIDTRVIAATNKNLKSEVEAGRFREDLFYRLNVFPIHVPPLRDRMADLPILIRHFVQLFNNELQKNVRSVTPDAMKILTSQSWPGNVRELKNAIHRMMVMASRDQLTTGEIPAEFIPKTPLTARSEQDTAVRTLEEMEKEYIETIIKKCNGNKAEAARQLGLKKSTLYMKLNKMESEE